MINSRCEDDDDDVYAFSPRVVNPLRETPNKPFEQQSHNNTPKVFPVYALPVDWPASGLVFMESELVDQTRQIRDQWECFESVTRAYCIILYLIYMYTHECTLRVCANLQYIGNLLQLNLGEWQQ